MKVLGAKSYQPGFKPMLEGYQNPLNIDALTVLDVDTAYVHEAPDENHRYHMLPQIAYFDDQFIAIWTAGPNEGLVGDHTVYATSKDGFNWSEMAFVTPETTGDKTEASDGLWIRNGELWALHQWMTQGAFNEGEHYYGDDLELRGSKWTGHGWDVHQTILTDCMLDKAPILLRTGKWYATGRDRDFRTQMILGDMGNWQRIIVPSPSDDVLLNECTLMPTGNGSIITYEYRNSMPMEPRRLLRSFSYDDGVTITTPVVTAFPDGESRRATMRLSDGRYVMCSNASNEERRKKLMLSVSDDGFVYDRVYILRGEPTTPKWGSINDRVGYQYPQMIQLGNYLWVIYSQSKEDIQISRVDVTTFA